jgi:MFS family permease
MATTQARDAGRTADEEEEALRRARAMAMARSGGGRGGGSDATNLLQIHKTFSALSIPAFRFLWASMLFSFLGMQMQMVARGVLAYQIGGTNSAIAIVSLGWGLPMLFFSLVGGTIADRMDKRKLMMFSQLWTAVLALSIAVLVDAGLIRLSYLFISGLLQGMVFAFSGPARSAFIPELVGEKEMMNAIALNSAGMNLTRIAGPFLAGSLIAVPFIDVQGVYYLQAFLNIVALGLIMVIPFAQRRSNLGTTEQTFAQSFGIRGREDRQPVIKELVEGLRYVVGSPILLTLLSMALVPTLLGMSYQSFLPVFARDIFGDGIHRNAEGLGVMMTLSGIGALVGSLVVASMQDFPRRALLQLFGGLGFGVFLAVFAVQGTFGLALFALVMLGFMSAYFQALNSTMVMSASDPNYYGRVMSVYMMTFSLMPLGTLPMGFVADLIKDPSIGPISILGLQFGVMEGIQAVNLGAGLILTAFILLVTVANPAYRQLEQNDLKLFATMAVDRLKEDQEGGSAWAQLRRSFRQERGASAVRQLRDAKGSSGPARDPTTASAKRP